MRRALWLVPVVLLFAVGGVALFRARPAAELGRPAPALDLPDLARPGERIALERLRGRPVVINFWASWCDPCRAHATFLGVNILDGRDEALAYAKRYGIPYASVRDTRGIAAKRFGVTGVPETVFIDREGNVVGKYIGAFEPGQLEPIVRRLIALKPGGLLRLSGRGETRPVP